MDYCDRMWSTLSPTRIRGGSLGAVSLEQITGSQVVDLVNTHGAIMVSASSNPPNIHNCTTEIKECADGDRYENVVCVDVVSGKIRVKVLKEHTDNTAEQTGLKRRHQRSLTPDALPTECQRPPTPTVAPTSKRSCCSIAVVSIVCVTYLAMLAALYYGMWVPWTAQ